MRMVIDSDDGHKQTLHQIVKEVNATADKR